jgi:hypothetical protein
MGKLSSPSSWLVLAAAFGCTTLVVLQLVQFEPNSEPLAVSLLASDQSGSRQLLQQKEPPHQVGELIVSQIRPTKFTIRWNSPHGYKIEGYTVFVNAQPTALGEYDAGLDACDSVGRCSLRITKLIPRKLFQVQVSATNMFGTGAYSKSLEVETSPIFTTSWSCGVAGPSNVFALFYSADTTAEGYDHFLPKLFVSGTGELWAAADSGYLATLPSNESLIAHPKTGVLQKTREAVGPLDWNMKPLGYIFESGPWTIGPTKTGAVGFDFQDMVRTAVLPDGQLYASDSNAVVAIKEPLNEYYAKPEEINARAEDEATVASILRDNTLVPGTMLFMGAWNLGMHQATSAYCFNHAKRIERSDGSYNDFETEAILLLNGALWLRNGGKSGFADRKSFAPRNLDFIAEELVPTAMTDCDVGLWSMYNQCNRNCHIGTKLRFRSVVQPSANNGAVCPALSDYNECGDKPCTCGELVLPQLSGLVLYQPNPKNVEEFNLLVWYRTKLVQLVYTKQNDRPGRLLEFKAGIQALEFSSTFCFQTLPSPFTGGMRGVISKGMPLGVSGEVFLTTYGNWVSWSLRENKQTMAAHKIKGSVWWKQIPKVCHDNVHGAVFSGYTEWAGTETTILFCSDYWVRFNTVNFEVVEGPNSIHLKPWSGSMPAPFNSRVDAAFSTPQSNYTNSYIFSGVWGLLWDPAEDVILEGPFAIDTHPLFREVVPELGVCDDG